MFVLRELSSKTGWASIRSRNYLRDILKITSKKKHPEIITFTFSSKTEQDPERRLRFFIPDSQTCVKKLKEHLVKLSVE